MRLTLLSLIAAVATAPLAMAQTATTPAASQPMAITPAPTAQVPAATAAQTQTAPAAQAPGAAPAPAAQPPATPPPAPPPPPPPPPPPTDPMAIEVLNTLQNVCIPSVEGGAFERLAKSDGYRKSGDTFVKKGRGYQLTLWAPGANPNQCHVDLEGPVFPEGPAAPTVVALHNWAAVERGWTLYRNDKSVQGDQELTTRSWEHDDAGKHEAMFITTYRHADGTPLHRGSDSSTLVYSETKSS